MQDKTILLKTSRERNPLFLLLITIIITALFPAISLADAERIFKENSKAVVVVVTFDEKGKPIGQGSGFIVRADGAIVTNYHVISNAGDIAVKSGDKVLEVEGLLYIDKEDDIVILKAKGKNLPIVKIGDIGKMNVGDKVYVISSPQGLENTISDGILSGIREITPQRKILQITAPVSSGSSGGPVFNKNGEVIGIATFLIEEAQNLNFAMPVNLIKNKIGSKRVTALKDVIAEDYEKLLKEQYDKEIKEYSKVIALNPNFADAYFFRGVAYGKKGQYDKAIADYNMAIALNPNDASAYRNRGVAYGKKGQHNRAIEDFNKAIALNPNDAEAYYGRGDTYFYEKQYDRAIEDFTKAIALNPNRFSYRYSAAITYHLRGFVYHLEKQQYDKAIADYDKAIELYPNYAEAYKHRGDCYWEKDQYDRAIEDYDKAIALYSNDPAAFRSDTQAYRSRAYAYKGRGRIHYEKGQYDKAIEDYSKVIELNPDADYKDFLAMDYNDRGLAYAGKGQYDRAIEDYDKAIALSNDISAYFYRGLAYAGKGQYDRAIEDYDKVISLYPNDALTYFYRGSIYYRKQQYDKAIEDYSKVIVLNIALNQNFALAYFYRGNTYHDKGQYDKAIEDYSKVISLNPNDVEAYFYHINYYNSWVENFNRTIKDDIRAIIEDYNKAIALNPNNASAYIKRGLVYFLSGNRGRAISDLQKACDMGNETACKVLKKELQDIEKTVESGPWEDYQIDWSRLPDKPKIIDPFEPQKQSK